MSDLVQTTASLNIQEVRGMATEVLVEVSVGVTVTTTVSVLLGAATLIDPIRTRAEHLVVSSSFMHESAKILATPHFVMTLCARLDALPF